jgi:hypothetical protein
MATSPLFGWEEPDDVDLVKDGAAAIRTLGNAIDTSMGDLLGGTSGQVLSKNSNTNMDFTWVTPDDANAIQNAIVDAKGDLIAASAADTPARLAVGNNGETLVADSSTSTGLRYQGSMAAGKNTVINGGFDIWQRGTSAVNQSFLADRWQQFGNGSITTVSRQATGDTTNLPFIQYAARIQRTSGQTGTALTYFSNTFETVNSVPLAGKTVTLSFYARAGANYSATSNGLGVYLNSGTGTDQNVYSGFSGAALPISSGATLTTTWQRFTYTATVASTATQLAIYFTYQPVGTAGANDYFDITGVQLELGSVATAFSRNGATIQGELAACQRYFQVISGDAEVMGSYYTTTNAVLSYKCPVEMRVAPTPTYNTTYTNAIDQVGVANRTPTAYATSYVGKSGLTFFATGTATATAYNPVIYRGGNHLLSAEL